MPRPCNASPRACTSARRSQRSSRSWTRSSTAWLSGYARAKHSVSCSELSSLPLRQRARPQARRSRSRSAAASGPKVSRSLASRRMARARWGTRRVLLTRASLFAGDAVLLHHAVEVVAIDRNNNVYAVLHQSGRQCRQAIVLAFGQVVDDRDVLALDISGLFQPLEKRRNQMAGAFDRCAPQEPDHRHRRLLRARRERPCHSAAEQSDEFASFHPGDHSITSSARASSVSGTVRPSARAVVMLITKSYLVGACTGRSPGFSPLRMRST